MTQKVTTSYSFTYDIDASRSVGNEQFYETNKTIPLDIFKHASALQAISRYLVDTQSYSFSEVARLLARSPKTIWASYNQTGSLPAIDEEGPRIPLHIFIDTPPLQALVVHLRNEGMKNKDVAEVLELSPKTTSTTYRRWEVRG